MELRTVVMEAMVMEWASAISLEWCITGFTKVILARRFGSYVRCLPKFGHRAENFTSCHLQSMYCSFSKDYGAQGSDLSRFRASLQHFDAAHHERQRRNRVILDFPKFCALLIRRNRTQHSQSSPYTSSQLQGQGLLSFQFGAYGSSHVGVISKVVRDPFRHCV